MDIISATSASGESHKFKDAVIGFDDDDHFKMNNSKARYDSTAWNEDYIFSKLAVSASSALSSGLVIAAHHAGSPGTGRTLALAYGSAGLACSLWFWVRAALHVRGRGTRDTTPALILWLIWILDIMTTAVLYLGGAYLFFRTGYRSQSLSPEVYTGSFTFTQNSI